MNRSVYIFLSLLTPTFASAQYYLTPENSVLRTNKVKKLTVLNCIDSSDCFMDVFEYNKLGLITKESPGIVAVYSEWVYYKNGKLKTYYSKVHPSGNGDSIFIAEHYYYDKNWKFQRMISSQFENAKIISIDTIYKPREDIEPSGKKNQKGQITQQELGDLYFPCAIHFEGKHKIIYEYFNNGLLQNAKIFDDKAKLLINFTYNYDYF